MERPDEAAVFEEFIDLFVTETPEALSELREACSSTHATGLEEAAHALKGSCSNLGADRMAMLCSNLEQAAQQNPIVNIAELIDLIDQEFVEVTKLLLLERVSPRTVG